MTRESAARIRLSVEPRFSLEILRSLRAEVDALLGFLPSDSSDGEGAKAMKTGKSQDRQPELFEIDEQPALRWRPAQKMQLATLVEALLLEIAAALASEGGRR